MKYLYLVIYNSEDNGQEWSTVIAKDSEEAIKETLQEVADIIGITFAEVEEYATDLEAYKLDRLGEYEINVVKSSNKTS